MYNYKVKRLVPEEKWEIRPQYDDRDFLYNTSIPFGAMEDPIINSKTITHIKTQVNGSCGGESGSYSIDSKTGCVTSGEFIYRNAKKHDEFPGQEGTSLLAVCKALHKYGACKDELYPRVGEIPYNQYPEPSTEAMIDAEKRKIDSYLRSPNDPSIIYSCLKSFGQIILGVLVTTNYFYPEYNEKGEVFIDLPSGQIYGGHATTAFDIFPNLEFTYKSGVRRKGFVRFVNSWGPGWGHNGYAYLPFDFITSKLDDLIPYCMDIRVPVITSLKNKAKVVDMDIAPSIVAGRTVLPIRHLAESLGANVTWYKDEGRIKMLKDNNTVNMFIGSNTAYVNGESKEMDIAPFTLSVPGGDRTMLPARFVAEFLGGKVNYQGSDKRIQTIIGDKEAYMFVDRKYLVLK